MSITNEQSTNEISIAVDESCDLQTEYQCCMIKRVPEILKSVEANKNCFTHSLITLGPYQVLKDNAKLDRGTELKTSLMSKFLKDYKPSIINSTLGIKTLALEARKFYTSDATKHIADYVFANMMLLDGCAILQFISCAVKENWDELNIKYYEKLLFVNDLFLLENQIPFLVLKQLMPELKGMCNEFIKNIMPSCADRSSMSSNWLTITHFSNNKDKTNYKPDQNPSTEISISLSLGHNHENPSENSNTNTSHNHRNPMQHDPNENAETSTSHNQEKSFHHDPNEAAHTSTNYTHNHEDPLHLLDMLWKHCSQIDFIPQPLKPSKNINNGNWFTFRSAKALKAAGILFSHSKSSNFDDVKCEPLTFLPRSYLSLPPIIVDDSTKSFLLNLAAYEMTSSRPKSYRVSSYLCLMASLINDAEDVSILRRSGIILNCLGSDQQVAKLFNDIAQHLVSDMKAYRHIKVQIEQHCSNQMKIWINEFIHTHFRSPWTLLAFIAAIIVLYNTVLQIVKAFTD